MERPARRSPYLGTASALIGAILAASPVSAHEFWIEPADFSIEAGATIEADLRVGQDFTGDAFPYIPSRFAAFERHDRLGAADVEGVTGDLPALSLLPRTEGLSIFTYVSARRTHPVPAVGQVPVLSGLRGSRQDCRRSRRPRASA
ncbi:DUF4198 domain-containing protein [Hoeflea alexandrii]|uniref:hypothetical protein n=1 Tax=Hoeflea alexandrii TaxID=288436 RepID=UPI00227073A9|nr:hypothetical protein [Hoeflea alexandrii]MCY0154006.1 DUF4198 domain-containing protein [Hoeflea alexandrii]